MSSELLIQQYQQELRAYASNVDHRFFRLTEHNSILLRYGYSPAEIIQLRRAAAQLSDIERCASDMHFLPKQGMYYLVLRNVHEESRSQDKPRLVVDSLKNEGLYIYRRASIVDHYTNLFPELFNLQDIPTENDDPFDIFARSIAIHQALGTDISRPDYSWNIDINTNTVNVLTTFGNAAYKVLHYQGENNSFFIKIPNTDVSANFRVDTTPSV